MQEAKIKKKDRVYIAHKEYLANSIPPHYSPLNPARAKLARVI